MCEACSGGSFGRRDLLRLAGAAAAFAMLPGRSVRADDEIEVAPGLRVRPRSTWDGGRRPNAPLPPEEVRFLLVHHTGAYRRYDEADVPGILRSIYDYHTSATKQWPDTCYHFLVDQFGGVWEGRTGSLDGPVIADATGGNQGFAQLVCLIGDFSEEPPTEAAQASLIRTLAWLAERYGIDTRPGATTQFVSRGSNRWTAGTAVTASTISGHRDMSETTCPGDAFYPILVDRYAELVTIERVVMFPPIVQVPTTTTSTTTTTTAPPPPTTTTSTTTTTTSTTAAATTTTTLPATGTASTTVPPAATPTSAPRSSGSSGRPSGPMIAAAVLAATAVATGTGLTVARRGARTSADDHHSGDTDG